MLKNSLNFYLSLTFLGLNACSTTRPEIVPEVDFTKIPAFEFKNLKPRKINLSVKNSRKINKEAKNTEQVEKRVFDVFTDSLKRGNIAVSKSTPVTLDVLIRDCDQVENGLECISVNAKLDTPRFTLENGASSTNGYVREGTNAYSFGDVSKSYESAIKGVVEGLNAQYLTHE